MSDQSKTQQAFSIDSAAKRAAPSRRLRETFVDLFGPYGILIWILVLSCLILPPILEIALLWTREHFG